MTHVSAPDQARWSGKTRRAAGAAVAVTGLILVAGCHVPGTGSSAAAGPTASGTVTVVAAPSVADAPLYIGIRDGLFSRAGLTVHVVPTSSVAQEVSALRAGSADVAFGDYADMFYQQELKSSPHLALVADGYDAGPNVMEVLTLPGSRITSPADLEHKSIGTPAQQGMPTKVNNNPLPYSQETLATWSVLNSDHVSPADIAWTPMPSTDLITALRTHAVDAILATEPTIYEAESELGAVPVLDACTGATANLPLAGYFTDNAYASHHAAVIAAFRAALERAQAQGAMAAPIQAALTKSVGLRPQTAELVTFGQYPTTLSAQNVQRVVDLMFFFNTLGKTFNVSSMLASHAAGTAK